MARRATDQPSSASQPASQSTQHTRANPNLTSPSNHPTPVILATSHTHRHTLSLSHASTSVLALAPTRALHPPATSSCDKTQEPVALSLASAHILSSTLIRPHQPSQLSFTLKHLIQTLRSQDELPKAQDRDGRDEVVSCLAYSVPLIESTKLTTRTLPSAQAHVRL